MNRIPAYTRWLAVPAAVVTAMALISIPEARASASSAATGYYTPFGVADWDGDGHQDVLARNATGDLWLEPGAGGRGPRPVTGFFLESGWTGWTPFGVADWDGDGHQDVVARQDSTGTLWLEPGVGGRDPRPAVGFFLESGW